MKKNGRHAYAVVMVLAGLTAAMVLILVSPGWVSAAPVAQSDEEAEEPAAEPLKDCGECHLDVLDSWSHSPHAHAYDDPVFQERWVGMGEQKECLVCHTTGFQSSTGEFSAEGVQCVACHGEASADHPPAPVAIKADTEYCGICHTTTLGEWRLTGHSSTNIGCSDCHDPHSQQALFDEPDDLCLNCHKDAMGDYLEDMHVSKGIGCVDCHALVIPPDEIPEDGIVPTGHAFNITPATCVACHTDALHAGFSLPGYENGAAGAVSDEDEPEIAEASLAEAEEEEERSRLSPAQQIQALEAALASRNLSLLFQGAIIGLVLGGSTAWIVAHNVRRGRGETAEAHQQAQTSEEHPDE